MFELHFKTNEKLSEKESAIASADLFPALAIFLPILEEEYRQEKIRTERIDSKALALLTFMIALITVYVPLFPFKEVTELYTQPINCSFKYCILSVFLLFGFAAICLAIYSTKKLTDVYKPTAFQAVNIEELNNNEKISYDTTAPFQLELIEHYLAIILNNSKINSQKAKILSNQFRNTLIIFVLLTLSAIGSSICVHL